MAKIQNLKFHQSLQNFGRDPPLKYAWFFWANLCYVLSDKMSLKFFSPIWSYVNENEKKSKMQNFEKQKKNLEIWWKGTFPPNFKLQ